MPHRFFCFSIRFLLFLSLKQLKNTIYPPNKPLFSLKLTFNHAKNEKLTQKNNLEARFSFLVR